MQGLWRTADVVDPMLLEAVVARLARGVLGRRIVRPRVPGARFASVPAGWSYPLAYRAEPLALQHITSWADAQARNLDPSRGPGFRLSAVLLSDGGTLVSLLCSHVLTDARGLLAAVDTALRETAGPPPGGAALSATAHDTATSHRAGTGPLGGHATDSASHPAAGTARLSFGDRKPAISTAGSTRTGSDWADARRTWSTVIRGFRPWRGRAHNAVDPTSSRPSPTAELPAKPAYGRVTSAFVHVDAAAWDALAAASDATANTLFVATVANILWDSGFSVDRIHASLPVDLRAQRPADPPRQTTPSDPPRQTAPSDTPRQTAPGDTPRGNSLAMCAASIERGADLAAVREACRAAFAHPDGAPPGVPPELLHLLPARLAHLATSGAGERDVLCSNIGRVPDSLLSLGPHRALGVAARAVHPGITPRQLHHLRTRLSGYLLQVGDHYRLALVGLDARLFPSDTQLRDLAIERITALGLRADAW